MTPRALILRQVDALHDSQHDTVLAKCLGVIALGALILLTAAHNLTNG